MVNNLRRVHILVVLKDFKILYEVSDADLLIVSMWVAHFKSEEMGMPRSLTQVQDATYVFSRKNCVVFDCTLGFLIEMTLHLCGASFSCLSLRK